MRDDPPPDLAELLARLHLATAEQVAAAGGYAHRMAGDLPLFVSVWIDALLQSRLLTPYQAAEINAGRGQQLLVGPYVIRHALGNLGYAQSFTAWEIHHPETEPTPKSRRKAQLVVKRCRSASAAEQAAAKLESMIARFAEFKPSRIAPLTAAGADGNTLWAAFEAVDGFPVGDTVACSGRIAPGAAMEIARQMAAALEGLHQAGLVHGDISARSLWFNAHGEIRLTHCGVRGVMESDAVDPSEPRPLEAFDYLAPERMSGKSPPKLSTDIYACGCLWWHLLAGRPPLLGGDLIGKTRAVSRPKIANIRHIAPDTPEAWRRRSMPARRSIRPNVRHRLPNWPRNLDCPVAGEIADWRLSSPPADIRYGVPAAGKHNFAGNMPVNRCWPPPHACSCWPRPPGRCGDRGIRRIGHSERKRQRLLRSMVICL